MPTGYTARVGEKDDMSLTEFAWICARQFGFMLLQRDNAMDAPIRMVEEPSDYYQKSANQISCDIAEAEQMSDTDYSQFRDSKIAEQLGQWEESRIRAQATIDKYKAMLSKVEAWQAPEELAGMKAFMQEQLTRSIDFDKPSETPWGVNMPETRADYIDSLRARLAREEDEWAEEVQRTNERNRYRQLLADSVGMPPSVA